MFDQGGSNTISPKYNDKRGAAQAYHIPPHPFGLDVRPTFIVSSSLITARRTVRTYIQTCPILHCTIAPVAVGGTVRYLN